MTRCPKCSGHRIDGPYWQIGPYGYECLRYKCATCGYSETRPTHDSEEPSAPVSGGSVRGESHGNA